MHEAKKRPIQVNTMDPILLWFPNENNKNENNDFGTATFFHSYCYGFEEEKRKN